MKINNVIDNNNNFDRKHRIYRSDCNNENNTNNSMFFSSYEVRNNIVPTNIRLLFNTNKTCSCNVDDEINDANLNNNQSIYSTKIHSAESTLPNDINVIDDNTSNRNLRNEECFYSAINMIHAVCSDEFLCNEDNFKKNVKINTQENLKLLTNDNKYLIKKLRFTKSLPWVIFQNDKHFSFGKSSIKKTRASVALSEQYYHIPVPNSFFRQPIFQLLKSIRKIMNKPCEIEQLVNLNPIDPYLVEQYLIKSREIYSADSRLVTDLLLTNTDINLIDRCMKVILDVKTDRIIDNENFRIKLRSNLFYIQNATKSRYLINLFAKINFDPEKQSHNNLLNSLWDCYFPNGTEVKWELLGFQRCDQPSSDFRGVGVLALICLLYFSLAHPVESRIIHEESSHSKYWYSFAVTGINITSWLRDWLNQRDHRIIQFFYKTDNDTNMLIIFCELFSFIFLKFHSFWMEKKPKNILEFPSIAQQFKCKIQFPLSDKIYYEDTKKSWMVK